MQALDRSESEVFDEAVLRPRGLDYRLRFPGPGGGDAVAAALPVAREATGRRRLIAFTRGSGAAKPPGAWIMPYDGSLGHGVDTLDVLASRIEDGAGTPGAIVVETVQADGVNVASFKWLRGLERLARELGALLIVDETRTGWGRCGPFFSFEAAGITPDLVWLSRTPSGLGPPVALISPDVDRRAPAGGSLREHGAAFAAAAPALGHWRSGYLSDEVRRKGAIAGDRLRAIVRRRPELGAQVRGRGLMQGLDLGVGGLAAEIARNARDAGLDIETCGPDDRVLRLQPPLTISDRDLASGLDAIEAAVDAAAPATEWLTAA